MSPDKGNPNVRNQKKVLRKRLALLFGEDGQEADIPDWLIEGATTHTLGRLIEMMAEAKARYRQDHR